MVFCTVCNRSIIQVPLCGVCYEEIRINNKICCEICIDEYVEIIVIENKDYLLCNICCKKYSD